LDGQREIVVAGSIYHHIISVHLGNIAAVSWHEVLRVIFIVLYFLTIVNTLTASMGTEGTGVVFLLVVGIFIQ
jgi:hypothetical protein